MQSLRPRWRIKKGDPEGTTLGWWGSRKGRRDIVDKLKQRTGRWATPPKLGAPPETIINRIFNYRDHNAILQAARVHVDLHIDNTTIKFFPDFT